MKLVPVNGLGFAKVDDEDFEEISRHKWSGKARGRASYAMRTVRKRCDCQPSCRGTVFSSVLMHRQIFGSIPGFYVDHIDGDGLNNQRANLRSATRGENAQNQRPHTRPDSSWTVRKGVTLIKRPLAKPWRAKIGVAGKKIHLGFFATEDEAALAYDAAARRHFGAFARTNFPEDHLAAPGV